MEDKDRVANFKNAADNRLANDSSISLAEVEKIVKKGTVRDEKVIGQIEKRKRWAELKKASRWKKAGKGYGEMEVCVGCTYLGKGGKTDGQKSKDREAEGEMEGSKEEV